MATDTHYTDAEWALIKAAPHWVFAALSAADGRVGAITANKEKVAMAKVLEDADANNILVRAAVDAGDDKHDVPSRVTKDDAIAQLAKVNDIVEDKVGREAGEEYRDFLMDVANEVAGAAKEGLLNTKQAVSDEEKEALQEIAVALQATAAYKQRRINVEKKAEREAAADAKAAADKAAAAKAAATARAKAEDDSRANAQSAHRKRIAEARARKAATERKAAEDAKKRQAERTAARDAAAQKRKVAEAKQRADKMAAARKVEVAKAAAEKAAAEAAAAVVAEHTVGGGDSLSAIAARYYGSGVRANWMAIYEANKDVIGGNPSLIIPGQVLKIPKL